MSFQDFIFAIGSLITLAAFIFTLIDSRKGYR